MSNNKSLRADDLRYLWHPFTQAKEYEAEEAPIIAAGEGSYLIDTEGRRYLDGVSSLWVNVHGHSCPEIDRAIMAQLGQIAHSTLLGLGNVPSIELARELITRAPAGLKRVFYSDNGSTAVEVALKIAFQYAQQTGHKQKTGFLSFINAYHGDTLGAVGVGGIDLFHRIYGPLAVKSMRVPAAYCYRCHLGLDYPDCELACFKELESTVAGHAHELAAIIIEPCVQGAAGMLIWPEGYLRRLRQLTERYGILLIADEVATGFGRTGTLFACEQEGVSPDLMALAKGITGGYLPLAATLTTEEIFMAFYGDYEEEKTFFHGHTYTGNPLACAAALANLRLFETNQTILSLQPKIKYLKDKLNEFNELSHVGEIRQRGFMVGMELVEDKAARRPYPVSMRMGRRVILEARRHGLIIRPLGDVVVLMPPLSVSLEELDAIVSVTYGSIKKVTEED
ncbi:MAG: adenosylmethionine--8-amino-7-oxononanoate transaminase [Thermodesulfobacteriota bacterium]